MRCSRDGEEISASVAKLARWKVEKLPDDFTFLCQTLTKVFRIMLSSIYAADAAGVKKFWGISQKLLEPAT